MRLARLAWYTAVHWAWTSGLRGYCWPCDKLRWAWTHRSCDERRHAANQAAAAELGPLVREWLDRRDKGEP